jgi:hypothetical protein
MITLPGAKCAISRSASPAVRAAAISAVCRANSSASADETGSAAAGVQLCD